MKEQVYAPSDLNLLITKGNMQMKIMTTLGTRPEIIRLSRIIPLLDKVCDHIFVHTGQNYDQRLNDIFFRDLELRSPNFILNCQASTTMGQIGEILYKCEQVMIKERPDRLLILGDTNSALAAMAAKRLSIPVYHMEAGNRCYDDRVPEEINRRVIDHCSDILMPYTERSRANLLKEGIDGNRIFVTGNPIKEVLSYYADKIRQSQILETLGVSSKSYFLVTLHRAENVDDEVRFSKFIASFHKLYKDYKIPLICSLHPRTRSQLQKQSKILEGGGIKIVEPLGLFDFVCLEQNAFCVLSDSGTVQEECSLFKVANVTLRDVTERPETVESGSNILSGCKLENILRAVEIAISMGCDWEAPVEYLEHNVSRKVLKILLGY
ncbi:non-hydrolyzing UDP-N-acetylglucosamine 2-epimerase [Desulfosporosinus meridiei]|uniref:UDP-N-acetylglucosamine 2-epimerase n=1 Tax=Desulfosporosinus meridiei (strain ATCC BAA-275 / DSM 13257 / KCTC 12902 / NCIMB 13706 / S10) TaxID=768704 RepID=J7IQG9_DESMD|nr:UDP-N-acetylglucosamine 2-epimerase (non-hydrolyzing) [Desulfosporosinus meridiei]AFQ42414.1 UDP-N-acetylglucosamine 2-epimerase [Desulfosporosinus meridiei DSM 13257]